MAPTRSSLRLVRSILRRSGSLLVRGGPKLPNGLRISL